MSVLVLAAEATLCLAHTLVEFDMRRFAMVSTGWKTSSSAIPAQPDPSNLAVPDCLLYSLVAEPMAGAMAGGDMVARYLSNARKDTKVDSRQTGRINGPTLLLENYVGKSSEIVE